MKISLFKRIRFWFWWLFQKIISWISPDWKDFKMKYLDIEFIFFLKNIMHRVNNRRIS